MERQTAAGRDWLTGLGNRETLQAALASLAPGAGVLLVRVAGLNQVNGSLGYRAGDELLALTAALLPADSAFRASGARFVLLSADGGAKSLPALARKLEADFSAALPQRFQGLGVGLTTGWAVFDSARHPSVAAALREADTHIL